MKWKYMYFSNGKFLMTITIKVKKIKIVLIMFKMLTSQLTHDNEIRDVPSWLSLLFWIIEYFDYYFSHTVIFCSAGVRSRLLKIQLIGLNFFRSFPRS